MVHERLIKTRLNDLGLSNDSFAVICGLSPNRLSRCFRDLESFTGEEVRTLSRLLEDISSIVQEAAPIPVALNTNPKIVRDLIEKRRRGLRIVPIFLGPVEVIEEIEREVATAAKQ